LSVISEVPAHNSFIKAMAFMPEHNIFLTACDKSISIWDTISLQSVGRLPAHKDEVRVLHTYDNYLFSAGKGSGNTPALFIWDLRQ
jgi:WD40 repeat protein